MAPPPPLLGQHVKRLLGDSPVRMRKAAAESCFLLKDCSDVDAAARVQHKDTLQFAGGGVVDDAPLMLDIDRLDQGANALPAADSIFARERLVCATHLLGVMLQTRYSIPVTWFSSGCQGVHGYAFGTWLSRPMREAVAALLYTGDARVFEHEAWSSPEVAAEADACVQRLQGLVGNAAAADDDDDSAVDTEWHARLRAATAPGASLPVKLIAVSAVFDTAPTLGAHLRVPLSYNPKGSTGYVGFPLPPTTDAFTAWPPIRRAATSEPLTAPHELDMLAAIPLPTVEQRADTTRRLLADCNALPARQKKRTLSEMEERVLRNWVPRLAPRTVALPSDVRLRQALVPLPIRNKLPAQVIELLECGVKRGGAPPCDWMPEPDNEHRTEMCTRGGGTGRHDQALALDALAGLNLDARGRGDVARSLLLSAFPVDCYARALKASPHVRRDVLAHWGSWFSTFAKGGATLGVAAWRYDGGFHDCVGVQCPTVRSQCQEAARVLLGGGDGGGGSGGGGTGGRHRAVGVPLQQQQQRQQPRHTATGRTVHVPLESSAQVQLEIVQPLLQRRAEAELAAGGEEGGLEGRVAELRHRADQQLRALHGPATATTDDGKPALELSEYVEGGGRLGYEASNGYCGIKGIYKEVRQVVFAGALSADIKRCHTSMLIGAHGRAVGLGTARPHALLDRMRQGMDELEADLLKDQRRLRAQGGGVVDDKYLKMEPKTLLSALLNHPNESPAFRQWPLAAECCRALGVAATAALKHPLVVADPARPSLAGLRPGSAQEKQRVAIILERRAVCALLECLEHRGGLKSSITINDEVLFFRVESNEEDTPAELETTLAQSVEGALGFAVRLRVRPVAGE